MFHQSLRSYRDFVMADDSAIYITTGKYMIKDMKTTS